MRFVYGPVPSWRLGRSLGVDALGGGQKRCTYDCVYCQLGPTPRGPILCDAWVNATLLAEELRAMRDVPVDYITFSGMGEPTLAANLGDLMRTAREVGNAPLAVLTNASMMNIPSVQEALCLADVVVAKLDAGEERMFREVNRPRCACSLAEVMQGICTFRQRFGGRLALQMMFVAANAGQAEMLAALARRLRPDEVQINTPLRPSPTPPLPSPVLTGIARVFDGLPVRQVYEVTKPEVIILDPVATRRRRPEHRPDEGGRQ